MATRHGPRLVEFNARFGDPECQVLMLRLESDLVPYLTACATGRLHEMPAPVWRDEDAVCVVLATEGYPGPAQAGSPIEGAEADFGPHVVVFQAGTSRGAGGELLAGAGRALNVCAVGADLAEARERAYGAIALIDWPQGFHRTDIAWRALSR
jgi:phosphoribosylamine--glycine ligase